MSQARIPQDIATKAIQQLQEYNGHTVVLQSLFLESVDDESGSTMFSMGWDLPKIDKLRSYKNWGYVMFRTPDSHKAWGFVCKSSQNEVTVLIEAQESLTFLLYDQGSRTKMTRGDVTELRFDVPESGASFVLNSGGLQGLNQRPHNSPLQADEGRKGSCLGVVAAFATIASTIALAALRG